VCTQRIGALRKLSTHLSVIIALVDICETNVNIHESILLVDML